jgi:hypothetical protein
MGLFSFLLGLLSMFGVCLALVPLLNIFNCIFLPVAILGALLGFVDLVRYKPPGEGRGFAIAGMTISLLAILLGGSRFLISLLTTGGIL